ncbi:hypothetical protein K501DRAFT_272693 [Backusella circina FSU 941]|nr:hypothetical protein K501DRAFT_272693 [Backusella circina FSU 941]
MQSDENPICPLSSIHVFERFENQRKKLKLCEDYHKKGILYHYMIGFDATKYLAERKKYTRDYQSRLNVLTATETVLKDWKNYSLKEVLKEANRLETMKADGVNKFGGYLNENEFTHHFLYPLFKQVLFDSPLLYRLGEAHLQCAAAETDDNQRTQSGPKIDIICLHKVHQFAVSVCEVSGTHYKTNRNHFLRDRNKLAMNMTSILNQNENISPIPNASAYKRANIY